MSIRSDIRDMFITDWKTIPDLKPVKVIATERAIDEVKAPTALIRFKRMHREKSAPLSTRRVGLLLTIISPYTDLDRAGDQLEELAEAVLDYLGPRILHDEAEMVAYGEDRLAIDIPLHIIATTE